MKRLLLIVLFSVYSLAAPFQVGKDGLVSAGNFDMGTNNISNIGVVEIDTSVVPFSIFEGRATAPAFQSHVSGNNTFWTFYTNDHDGTDTNMYRIYGLASTGPSASGDDHYLQFGWNNLGEYRVQSSIAGTAVPQPLAISVGNDTIADATKPNNLTISASSKTAGTGDGGDLILRAGSSAGGSYGVITFRRPNQSGVDTDSLKFVFGVSPNRWDIMNNASGTVISLPQAGGVNFNAAVSFGNQAVSNVASLEIDDNVSSAFTISSPELSTVLVGTSSAAIGMDSVIVGFGAADSVDTNAAIEAVAIGYEALKNHSLADTSSLTTAVGWRAGVAVEGAQANTLIGHSAGSNIVTGSGNTVIGAGATLASGTGSVVAVGSNAGVGFSGSNSILIGTGAASGGPGAYTGNFNIALASDSPGTGGGFTSLSASQEMIVGSGTVPITSFYLGAGGRTPNPAPSINMGTSLTTGTDVDGPNFTIVAGRGTGAGIPGSLILQTADIGSTGSSDQSATARMTLSEDSTTVHNPLVMEAESVTITADDQVVSVVSSLLIVDSDNATPSNRTFTLDDGIADGQVLTLVFADAVDAVELVDTSNACLSADWTPTDNDTLDLVWVGTCWHEKTRSAN